MMEWDILYFLQSRHGPVLDKLMSALSLSATAGAIWILLAVILALMPRTRRLGLVMGLALILMQLSCNEWLKPLFMRERPCWIDPSVHLLVPVPRDYSFPSGHAAASFAAASVLALARRWHLAWPALIWASGVAFSRLYLFVHFPSDVLAGVCLGFLCALLAVGVDALVARKMDVMPLWQK